MASGEQNVHQATGEKDGGGQPREGEPDAGRRLLVAKGTDIVTRARAAGTVLPRRLAADGPQVRSQACGQHGRERRPTETKCEQQTVKDDAGERHDHRHRRFAIKPLSPTNDNAHRGPNPGAGNLAPRSGRNQWQNNQGRRDRIQRDDVTARPRPEIGNRLVSSQAAGMYSLEKDAVAAHNVEGEQGRRKRVVASQIPAIGQVDEETIATPSTSELSQPAPRDTASERVCSEPLAVLQFPSDDLIALEPVFEPLESFGDAHSRMVTEVAAGRVDIEPMGRRELSGEEPRHRGFLLSPRQDVGQLQKAGGGERHGQRDRALDRRQAGGFEKVVDHIPERDRFALGHEISPARDGRAGLEPVGGEQMGFGGVVDIDRIDQRIAPADPPELSAPGAGENPRQQIVVAGAPDQVRPNRDRGQARRVGREDDLLGAGLGFRIRRLVTRRIGNRLVDAFHIPAVEYHAGRAAVDDSP